MTAFLPAEAIAALSPEAIGLLGNAASSLSSAPASAGAPSAGTSFGQMVSDGLGGINRQLAAGQVDLQRLAVGDAQNLHQIMINLEESRVSFQLMMQVRNRLLEAYQDIMKMPI
ncbi:flagellar hook-basal body complex protein FliE [Variovorax arabinosiphilus]|uniref:flagellar hook-basal body complex protein FliE n=1 Tax=Variovorax arabinosiphilus TaxID=3053498 RepID=UPI002574EA05|nr:MULTISPECIES: flagellar hook-basal body complex protein FliE [unclassified Variovorax]MDM0122189.1 flagellar hook-basal body complex protein FliE [Variovorax sp. J2L1-78]MDM0131282.1 flagellar hook-basal body complex protein FliE [Variovorax sp. J2L1-63]MDM0234952.1 flagellar hook-basal body complex protein FliE [Variovorax sp. J2R1-6]